MSYTDKVEAMDFLINVLKDHEKTLDELIGRAENMLEENNSPKNLLNNPPSLTINLKDWEEFCDRAVESEIICFDMINSTFYCNAVTETKVYRYTEEAPDITLELNEKNLVLSGLKMDKNIEESFSLLNGQLSNGLELKAQKIKTDGEKHTIQYTLDILYTKNWLSRELGVHRDFIVLGNTED